MRALIVVIGFLVFSSSSYAQLDPQALIEKAKEEAKRKIEEALSDPGTLNEALGSLEQADGIGDLVKSFNIRFKAFDTKDSDNTEASSSLGFEYSFDKSFFTKGSGDDSDPSGVSLNAHLRGNVAFDKEVNPNDFLDTAVRLHWFKWFTKALEDASEVEADLLQAAAIAAANFEGTPDELDNSQVWKDFYGTFEEQYLSHLGFEFLLDVAANLAIESDQDFSDKQYVYGAVVTGVPRNWNPKSPSNMLNFFDWPAAAVRKATGLDDWQPRGTAWPSFLAAVELVDPDENSARLAIDPDDDEYPRFRFELGYKSVVTEYEDDEIWLALGYRYYAEIGPSSQIRNADQHEFSYFAVSINHPSGLSLSYAAGRLPLDVEDDSVIELGFKFDF